MQTRTQAKNRVHKVLEDTNVKLSSVVTDLFGANGRRMLAAFIAGERDITTLAALALGKLRRKLPQCMTRSKRSIATQTGGAVAAGR